MIKHRHTWAGADLEGEGRAEEGKEAEEGSTRVSPARAHLEGQ